jgi:hypothetical protein
MDRERPVVGGEVAGMLFFQREETVETIAVPLEEKGGEQAGRPSIAVVVGVDGDELVVSQCRDERRGQAFRFSPADPVDEAGHQRGYVPRLGGQVDQGAGFGIPDRVLSVPVWGWPGSPMLHQGVQAPDEVLGEVRPPRRPFFDPQQGLPVIPDLADVALPAMEGKTMAGDNLLGLGECEPVPFDAGGVVGGADAGAAA